MGVQIQKQNKTLAFRLPAETWQRSHVPALEKRDTSFTGRTVGSASDALALFMGIVYGQKRHGEEKVKAKGGCAFCLLVRIRNVCQNGLTTTVIYGNILLLDKTNKSKRNGIG